MVLLNMKARAIREAIKRENEDSRILPENRIASNLRVVYGLKGTAALCMIWGFTFWFSWSSIISNPVDVDNMTSSLTFNVVSGAAYAAPSFFFLSGFCQTFSLMQKNEDEDQFTR